MLSDTRYTAFLDRVAVAATVKAKAISDEAVPSVEAKAWASGALNSPRAAAGSIVHFVIAANIGATTNQILSASDTAIQTNVNAAVDTLFGA